MLCVGVGPRPRHRSADCEEYRVPPDASVAGGGLSDTPEEGSDYLSGENVEVDRGRLPETV
ncbi:hypothetical protein [Halorussus aquaticus]|uniref:Uncharacterized protein n=1 Tax=Halorussus aquaticus TaxID=2953748 RepID=A0ABD5Q230_9EURY|nr:hypothetical protein [Halorussus aquaticus]